MYAYHFEEDGHCFAVYFSVIGGCEATQWEPAEPPQIEIETDGEDRQQVYLERGKRRRILPAALAEKVIDNLMTWHYDDMLEAADQYREARIEEQYESRTEARQEAYRRGLLDGLND